MADNRYISLKVCGNPHSNSGFMPIASFNSPMFDITDSVYSGFDGNSFFFSFKIERTQVVYKLIKNNVRSYQAIRPGSLFIAIAIPKGYKLAGGVTPYDVLIDLKDNFLSLCMTCRDSITDTYEFNNVITNPAVLDGVAQKYLLESCRGPFHPMTPGGPIGFLTAPDDKIRQCLGDVQYSELSSYSEVIIASSVKETSYPYIANLAIPRASRFLRIIDGLETGYIDDLTATNVISGKEDTRYFDNFKISFSIAELKAGKNVPNVIIDEENETVSIDTKPLSSPKSRTVAIVFDKSAQSHFYTFKSDFELAYGKKKITVVDYMFTLRGDEIAWLDAPSNFIARFARTGEYSVQGCRLTRGVQGDYQLEIITQKIVKPAEKDFLTVEVLLKHKDAEQTIMVYERTSLIQASKVKLTASGGKYKGIISIPKPSNLSAVTLQYETEESVYTSEIRHDKKTDTYMTSNFTEQTKSFYERNIKPRKTLYANLIGLILGLIVGAGLVYFLFPSQQGSSAASPQIKCYYCNKTFTDVAEYMDHLQLKHLSFICDHCHMRFESQDRLNEHLDKEQHLCDESEKKFISEDEPKKHKDHVHKSPVKAPIQPEKKFECRCPDCDQKFSNDTDRCNHELRDHKDKIHKCPHKGCGYYNFTGQDDLERHLKEVHNEE